MSGRLLPGLAALLLLQLLITVAVYWPRDDGGAAAAPALVDAELTTQAQRLRITGADGDGVVLARGDGGWILAEDGLPVAAGRVGRLLGVLRAAPGWPVARSEAARARFEVARDGYRRRIELLSGKDTLATVYLGTSPGFRKVHARAAGRDPIYSIRFNAYDAPATADGWLDRGLAAVGEPTAIAWSSRQLTRSEDGWSTATGETVDAERVTALVDALTGLQITGRATTTDAEAAAAATPAAALEIDTDEGGRELRLAADEDRRFVYSSSWDRWFSLSRYDYDRLLDALAALAAPAQPEGASGSGDDNG